MAEEDEREDEGVIDPFAPKPTWEVPKVKVIGTGETADQIKDRGGRVIQQEDIDNLPAGVSPQERADLQRRVVITEELGEDYDPADVKPYQEIEYGPEGEVLQRPDIAAAKKEKEQAHLKAQRDAAWDQGIVPGIKEELSQRLWWGEDIEGEFTGDPRGMNAPFKDFVPRTTVALRDLATLGEYDNFIEWTKNNKANSDIYAKAKEKGYESLSEKERKILQKQGLRRFVHGMTREGSGVYDVTPGEINRLALEEEWYQHTFRKELAEGTAPPRYLTRAPKVKPKSERKRLAQKSAVPLPVTGVTKIFDREAYPGPERAEKKWQENWRKRAEEIDPEAWDREFSEEERKQILGLEEEEQERREAEQNYVKKILKGEKDWQQLKKDTDTRMRAGVRIRMGEEYVEIKRPLTPAVRDMRGFEFMSPGKLSYDLQDMERRAVTQITEELLREEFGEEYQKLGHRVREKFPETYDEIVKKAKRMWFEDRAVLLNTNRGLAFYDADPHRTSQKIIERYKSGSIVPGLIELGPDWREKAHQLKKPGVGRPFGSGLVHMGDAVLPLMTAFTPRYSLHINSTHAEWTSHRIIDGLMGLDISNWLGAALKTQEERVLGYEKDQPKGPDAPGLTQPQERMRGQGDPMIFRANQYRMNELRELRGHVKSWAWETYGVQLSDRDIVDKRTSEIVFKMPDDHPEFPGREFSFGEGEDPQKWATEKLKSGEVSPNTVAGRLIQALADGTAVQTGTRDKHTIAIDDGPWSEIQKRVAASGWTEEKKRESLVPYEAIASRYAKLQSQMVTSGMAQEGRFVDLANARALFERSVTEQKIRESTGSNSLVACVQGAGGEGGAAEGIQQLCLPRVGPTYEQMKYLGDDLKMWANAYESFKEVQMGMGDDEMLERYVHHLRKGQFLFLAYDDLARLYGESIDADPDDIRMMRRSAILVGLSSMVTPGTGTDFVTPLFVPLGKGYKYLRVRYGAWKQDPKYLDRIADSTIRPSKKLGKIYRRDPALGESIEQEIKFEAGFKGTVRESVDRAEVAAQRKSEEAWMLEQEAGIYSSPLELPGGQLKDPVYRERWLKIRQSRIKKNNPNLEMSKKDLQEAALEDLRRLEVRNNGRIENSTAVGDVYRQGDDLYINTGVAWYKVADEDEIMRVRGYLAEKGKIRHPNQETLHYGRVKYAEIPDPSTATGTRRVIDDIEYNRRDFGSRLESFDKPPTFSRLAPDPGLSPGREWFDNWRKAGSETALDAEQMAGAKAWSVRDPYVNPHRRVGEGPPTPATKVVEPEDQPGLFDLTPDQPRTSPPPSRGSELPPRAVGTFDDSAEAITATRAGQIPSRVLEAREEALRAELAAREARAAVARADTKGWIDATSDDFIHINALRKEYDEVQAEIEKLNKRIEEIDLAGTDEFIAWTAQERKYLIRKAARIRAERAVERGVSKRGISGEAVPFADRRATAIGRTKRLKEAERLEREAGAELERLGKPIAAKQKEHKELFDRITGDLVPRKIGLRSAMTGAIDSWGQTWTGPTAWKGLAREVGEELVEDNEAILRVMQAAGDNADRLAKEAADNLTNHIKAHGSSLHPSREVTDAAASIKRASEASMKSLMANRRAEVTDAIIRKRANQIREGMSALSRLEGLDKVVGDTIKGSMLRTGSRTEDAVFDSKHFMRELTDAVGDKAIDFAIKNGGDVGSTLGRIKDATQRKWVKRPIHSDRSPDVHLNGIEVRNLHELPDVLRRAYKDSHKHRNSITAYEALKLAWKDPDLKAGWTLRWIAQTARGISRGFDPIKSKTGEMSEGLLDVARYAEHAHGHVRDELEALSRYVDKQAAKNRWTPQRRYDEMMSAYKRYLTTNDPLQVMRSRATFFNEGAESIWEQARWQMLHDPRSKFATKFREEAIEAGDAWAAGQAKKGIKVSKKDLEQYVEETYGQKLKDFEEVKGVPLRAIAHAWIPEVGFEGANYAQAARMYKQTYNALENNTTLEDFLNEVIKHSSSPTGWGRPTHDLKSLQHAAFAIAHAAIQYRANDMVVRAVGGFVKPQAAMDTARLFSNQAHLIKNWDEMTESLNRFGLPFTEHYLRRASGATLGMGPGGVSGQVASKELVATGVQRTLPPKVPSLEHVTPPPEIVEVPSGMAGRLGKSSKLEGVSWISREGIANHEKTRMFAMSIDDLPVVPLAERSDVKTLEVLDALDKGKKFRPPIIQRNPDGTYTVLSGKHTIEVLRARGATKMAVDMPNAPIRIVEPPGPAPTPRMVQPPAEPGHTIFMPASLAQTIDDAMPKITKDLKRRYSEAKTPAELRKLGAEFDYARLWKTSVVTGLVIPRPKYWWNNFIGDFSQMSFEHGLTTAAGVSTQLVVGESLNLLKHVPGSKMMRSFHDEMAKKFGGYEKTLGSTWNAFWNPHANKIWRGENGVLRSRYGQEYKFNEVREYMMNEGILDTMVHEELLRSFARHVPEEWTNKPFLPPGVRQTVDLLEEQRFNISWLATHVQQRQRGNLFMELLRQGYRPKDAARLTKEALYDWKHGITRFETMTIGKISPFYRFWRLAFGQIARRVLEPLTKPSKAAMDAMMGRSALSRTQQQIAAMESVPYLLDPEVAANWQDQQAIMDHAAKYYRPSWARQRGFTTVEPLDDVQMEHYKKQRRRSFTHSMGIMPPATVLDVTEIGASWATGFAAYLMSLEDERRPGMGAFRVSPDFSVRFWQPTLQMMFPTFKEPLEAMLMGAGIDTGGHRRGKWARISPSEKFMLDKLGAGTWLAGGASIGAALGGGVKGAVGMRRGVQTIAGAGIGAAMVAPYAMTETQPHPEKGYPVADAHSVAFMRMIPFLGNELPGVLDPTALDNPYVQKMIEDGDTKAGLMVPAIKWAFKGYSGIGKRYPMNPEHTQLWRAKDVQKYGRKYEEQMDRALEEGLEED